MAFVRGLAIFWGCTCLLLGWLKAFNWNSNDGLTSSTLLLVMFVLPLPTTLLAIWLPIAAGRLLLTYAVLAVVSALRILAKEHYPLISISLGVAHIAAYCVPHMGFGFTYLSKKATAEESP